VHLRRIRSESGAATAEVVVLFPILMVVLLFSVQFGLWYHASHVALTAAQEGARAGRQDPRADPNGPNPDQRGVEAGAERVARNFLGRLGAGIVVSPDVKATTNGDKVRVVVNGDVTSVMFIPGLTFPVHAVSEGPIEKFRPDQ
jgi:Flp pilus assembly protein TadG